MIAGRMLRQERVSQGITMRELAERLGVSRQYVSEIELRQTVGDAAAVRFLGAIEWLASLRDDRPTRPVETQIAIGGEAWSGPVKKIPQTCPVCAEEMTTPFVDRLVRHLTKAHADRIGRARARDVPGMMTARVRWRSFAMVAEDPLAVVWLDFPYSVDRIGPDRYAIEWERDGAAVPFDEVDRK